MKKWSWVIIAIAVTIPAIYAVFGDLHLDKKEPLLGAALFGLAVIGAAFMLSWACEVAQLDVPAALALSVLALVAVLPEYAVDFSLTYQAATNPAYEELAVANMIGANRTIVGFAWPLIIFLFWARFGKFAVKLEKTQRVEIGFLGVAGIYSLTIPLKGHIDFFDVVFLVALFVIYSVRLSRASVHEPELVGPAATIGTLPQTQRRLWAVGMLIYAAFIIFISAHPFAESLIQTGKSIGVDEVFMVQWFAPIASEAPEIVVCVLFTLRGLASAGLGTLVASKVNQWTLLVGTLPLVFSLGSGRFRELPLNGDQVGAMFVTSGQTLLAVAIMMNLSAHLWEGGLLLGLFVAQFFFPGKFLFFDFDAHYVFGVIYLILAAFLFFRIPLKEHWLIIRTMFDFSKDQHTTKEIIGEGEAIEEPAEAKPHAGVTANRQG